jgi:putative oligomerization/nucleic acid binding protein
MGDAVVSGDVPPEARQIVDQLEHAFPGAHIAVGSKAITDPAQIQAVLQAALGGSEDPESARVASLERLAKLHKQGALTDEEFAWEKKRILDAG